MGIKIILADGRKFIRDDIRALFERHPDMEVVAEAPDGRALIELVRELLPDVVVVDISMPGLISGIEATRQIVNKFPDVKIVAMSVNSDKQFVAEVLKAGASAYLLKDWAFKELVYAVSTVVKNHKYLSLGISDIFVEGYVHNLSSFDPSGYYAAQKNLRKRPLFFKD
jgi:DNA-binding NarL/FixJ family response regulator